MDKEILLRNASDVHPDFKDPEKILSRMEHFWSGHGNLGENIMNPRDVGIIGKNVDLENHRGEAFIRRSSVGMSYEGSVNPGISNAAWLKEFDTEDPNENLRIHRLRIASHWMAPLKAQSMQLGLSQRDQTPVILSTPSTESNDYGEYGQFKDISTTSIQRSNDRDAANKNVADAYSQMLNAHRENVSKAVEGRRDPFEHVRPSEVVSGLGSMVPDEHLMKIRNRSPHLVDPKYLKVDATTGISSWRSPDYYGDVIDLSTGTWAKISPDQFFPH